MHLSHLPLNARHLSRPKSAIFPPFGQTWPTPLVTQAPSIGHQPQLLFVPHPQSPMETEAQASQTTGVAGATCVVGQVRSAPTQVWDLGHQPHGPARAHEVHDLLSEHTSYSGNWAVPPFAHCCPLVRQTASLTHQAQVEPAATPHVEAPCSSQGSHRALATGATPLVHLAVLRTQVLVVLQKPHIGSLLQELHVVLAAHLSQAGWLAKLLSAQVAPAAKHTLWSLQKPHRASFE